MSSFLRSFRIPATAAALLLLGALLPSVDSRLTAQELTLKRDYAPLPGERCRAVVEELRADPPASPGPARAEEADRLASEASQAAILGDADRARRLLEEAAELDPTSPDILYRLGRLLEESGSDEEAATGYCRYLALAPDGAAAIEVHERLDRIAAGGEGGDEEGIARGDAEDDANGGRGLPAEEARAAFEEGIDAFDEGDFEEAIRHFSRALEEHPDWEEAHFNRAVAYYRQGQNSAGRADLESYLALRPEADDRNRVEQRLAEQPQEQPTQSFGALVPGPTTVLVTGLLMPGMGHVYSGQAQTGMVVLAGAALSAGAALLYRRVEVECLTLPEDGRCPPEQERSRQETRPLFGPGLGIAAAVTLGGALHAYFSARNTQARAAAAARARTGGSEAGFPAYPGGSPAYLSGASAVGGEGVSIGGLRALLLLEPTGWPEPAGLRAGVEVRF